MRNLTISSEYGLHLLSRHGVPVASDISRQIGTETKYFMSMFVDRANHQPCVIFCRASNHRDPYVHEHRYLLGWPGEWSRNTSSRKSTTTSIDGHFNTQKASFFAHITKKISAVSSKQAEDFNIASYLYRSIVEQVIEVFFETEALLLETTFAFQSETGRDASSMLAVDAHVVLDDAAYKSGGRQKEIHERVMASSTDDGIAAQASKDGIIYVKSVRDTPIRKTG